MSREIWSFRDARQVVKPGIIYNAAIGVHGAGGGARSAAACLGSREGNLMSEVRPRRRIFQSLVALFAGILATVIPSLLTDSLMHAAGVYPPIGEPTSQGLLAWALAYRIVYGVAGGFVVARLAPSKPMVHALILGGVGVAASSAGAAAMWGYGPAWYPLAVIASAVPCALAGARLNGRF
jgi:hypothetical protein